MDRSERKAEIRRVLAGARSVLVLSHHNPDGDAVGSMIAMGRGLRALGKRVALVNVGPIPDLLRWLDGVDAIAPLPPPGEDWDVAVLVDCNTVERTGLPAEALGSATLIVLDHHPAEEDGEALRLIDDAAPSAGLLVREILRDLGAPVDETSALALYVALYTDTGGFRFANTTAEAFSFAAELVGLGVKPQQAAQALHERESEARLRLLARALSTLTLSAEGRVADIHLTPAMFVETGTNGGDTDGFVNYPRSIAGVEVALILKELEPRLFRVGLRSRGKVDVSAIARKYGGGGHRAASGATMEGSVQEIRDRIVADVSAALGAERET